MEEVIKMNNVIKKTGAVLAAAALVASSITYNPVTTKAANEVSLVYEENTATAGTEVSYNFTVKDSDTVYVDLLVPQVVGGMMSFYQNDDYISAATLTEDSWKSAESIGIEGYIYSLKMTDPVAANWKVILNFNADTEYALSVSQEKETAVLSQNSITLTKGFSQKLSVSGAIGDIIWASSNNNIATVDSSGKVKAKKTGSAKITATTADGQVLTCVVSVQKNEYNEKRRYASSVEAGNSQVQVYNMFYDSKGNLVLKTSLLNNRGYRATKIKKLTIKINDASGKAIGTLKVKNKKISLNSGSSKDIKFIIKKSDLKNKKADLCTAEYKPSGTIIYQVPR